MNDASLTVRIGVTLLIIMMVQYYMWRRLVRDVGFRPWIRRALTGWAIGMFALTPLAMFGRRLNLGPSAQPLVMLVLCWGGFLLITLGMLLLVEPLRWLPRRNNGGEPQNPERRQVLQRVVGSTVASLGVIGSGTAVVQALGGPTVVPCRCRYRTSRPASRVSPSRRSQICISRHCWA